VCVFWKELTLGNQTVPIWEESEDSGSGIEPLKSAITAEKKRRIVPTIHVAQAPNFISYSAKKSVAKALSVVFSQNS
jgi:hypothetical protein